MFTYRLFVQQPLRSGKQKSACQCYIKVVNCIKFEGYRTGKDIFKIAYFCINNCIEIETEELGHIIAEGILEKKGRNVVKIDLTDLEHTVCDYFIIAHGDSGTQVRAIAENIEQHLKKKHKILAVHKEGFENLQWILLDYSTIIVHIFEKETRKYYQIEELWADGGIEYLSEVEDLEI